jgi:hypothetical protein
MRRILVLLALLLTLVAPAAGQALEKGKLQIGVGGKPLF